MIDFGHRQLGGKNREGRLACRCSAHKGVHYACGECHDRGIDYHVRTPAYMEQHLNVHQKGGNIRRSSKPAAKPATPQSTSEVGDGESASQPTPVAPSVAPAVVALVAPAVPSMLAANDGAPEVVAPLSLASPLPEDDGVATADVTPPSVVPPVVLPATAEVVHPKPRARSHGQTTVFWMNSRGCAVTLDGTLAPCKEGANNARPCNWVRAGYQLGKILSTIGPIAVGFQRYRCSRHGRRVTFWDPMLQPAVEARTALLLFCRSFTLFTWIRLMAIEI